MEQYDVRDVFTPTKPATLTFVERSSINDKLVQALRTPGKQIVVYGHSGSGKTTLLVNKLHQLYEDHITTRCMSTMTFDQLILDAFDQLNPYYDAEYSQKRTEQINASIQADYLGIKSQVGSAIADETQEKRLRVLPPQLTPQRLARFIGSARCCWVLEDFHKIASPRKPELMETMKVFVDMAVDFPEAKIIAIGAVGTAREVVAYNPNMRHRVSEIHVPLMTDEEIGHVLQKGEDLMNVHFTPGMRKDIVRYSNGLASVCHQLGLNICDAHGVLRSQLTSTVASTDDFEKALHDYLDDESDTVKDLFDRALRQKRKGKYDNCKLILEALASGAPEGGLTRAELSQYIKKKMPTYPSSNLAYYLEQLQRDDRGAILRLDSASQRYDFANPFHKVFARIMFSRSRSKPKEIQETLSSVTLSPERILDLISTVAAAAKLVRYLAP